MKVQVQETANPVRLENGQYAQGFLPLITEGHPLYVHEGAVPKTEHVPLQGGTFNFGMNDKGVVSFSYTPGPGEMRTGHGGDWSSNPMTFHEVTGIKAIEVAFRGTGKYSYSMVGHVMLDKLLPYLPDHLAPVKDTWVDSWCLVRKQEQEVA